MWLRACTSSWFSCYCDCKSCCCWYYCIQCHPCWIYCFCCCSRGLCQPWMRRPISKDNLFMKITCPSYSWQHVLHNYDHHWEGLYLKTINLWATQTYLELYYAYFFQGRWMLFEGDCAAIVTRCPNVKMWVFGIVQF